MYLCDIAGIGPHGKLASLCDHVEKLPHNAVLPNDKWKTRADALYDFFVTSEAPWRKDSRETRMDRYIEWRAKGVKSHHRAHLTQLSNALVCYTGLPPNKDIPGVFTSPEHRFTEILGRHNAIQEQAKQCGYSTILYSLSPSSSIFTPSFVNGWALSEPPRQRSCAVTSTSKGCRVKSVTLSGGLSRTVSVVRTHTRCPSCPRLMPTAYKQKCIECRRALRQTL
ncbi:putative membrane protein [Pseudomonas phage phiGM22-3]|uniref:Putative membrane protein n=1 Tax=Pseudomonas phage phiGM22-3 TaxID=2816462 RepID=A0A8T8IV67_9CAUD|nr:putative membrane protein [Pseudomonas phage phiGM22-3]